jgi:thiamine biosynthesis lipoprotein
MTTDGVHSLRTWSCTMRLVVSDHRVLDRATRDLTALLDRVEQAASRFRPDSALSIANARAGRPTPVPMLLTQLVSAALDAAAATGGAVDPTVGRSMHAIGYDRDIDAIEQDGPVVQPSTRSRTWQDVRVDREVGLLTVPVGTALDLGATAKAYTADFAARVISRRYGIAALVELGGDVAAAGDRPNGWQLRVAERASAHGQVVTIHRGGLTTSTTTVRHWMRGDDAVHHIIDPRTGLPADGPWRTASVYAESALAANTASTAAIVLGEAAEPWLDAHGYAARLLGRDATPHYIGGWPHEQRSAAVA